MAPLEMAVKYNGNRTPVDTGAPGREIQVSTSRFLQIILEEGWVAHDPATGRYYLRPDRGSGGYALYSTEHRLALQMSPGEQRVRARLVLEFM